ncbi:MAG: type I secretion system permease/ATPase [Rhodospirillaceae bacterium]|nr:type I secretion system permease/ATPase [Rhodospirillaceae bacterium]
MLDQTGQAEPQASDEVVAEEDVKHWELDPGERSADRFDPLLSCLVVVTKHFTRPVSPAALVSGLPLVDGMLTPSLFIRAAARAGLTGRLVRRPLAAIRNMVLPAVLLLKDRRACVLLGRDGDTADIVLPEAGEGVSRVSLAELDDNYDGFALFVRPEYQFDGRANEELAPRGKHWFWGTVSRFWPTYVEIMVAAAIINCLALASPLFVMNVYDRVVPNHATSTLWVLAIGVSMAYLFDFLLKSLRGALIDNAGKRADVLLASRLFEQVLNIQMQARPPTTGAFANQLREFESVRDFFTSSTIATLTDLMFVGLFVFVIYMIAGPLAYIPLAAVPTVIIIGLLIQVPLNHAVKATHHEAAQKHAILVETVSSLDTIKSLGAEAKMQRAWERFVGMTARTSQKSRFYSSLGINLSGFAQQAVSVITVVFGVYLISEGEMSMGGLIAATILGGRAVAPLTGVANTLSRFHQSRVALKSLNDLMAQPVERPADHQFVSRPITEGRIEFRNVTFTYPGGAEPALKNINFTISKGERVGIIGKIGSGKTTIGRLLIGLYQPTDGSVLIDDVDLRQCHPTDIRRGIGSVMQDVALFFGSVRDNISISYPYADDAMVVQAARLAGVDEFVGSNPQGYSLQVGERGQNLSGGQRQAIGLARALLLDPPILMLDEPTSAMDTASEMALIRRLREITEGGRTMVVTTHRATLLKLVDRILVLDKGRLLMDGPRDEVIRALQKGATPGQTQAQPPAAAAAETVTKRIQVG